ncbi:hypothetical protein KIPB_012173, partial [Kipferlia bialata]|eukprot:g12173.t1
MDTGFVTWSEYAPPSIQLASTMDSTALLTIEPKVLVFQDRKHSESRRSSQHIHL